MPMMALLQSRRAYVRTVPLADSLRPPQIVYAVVPFETAISICLQSGTDRAFSLDASESAALMYGHKMNTQEVSVA